jgi:hypothetical protein
MAKKIAWSHLTFFSFLMVAMKKDQRKAEGDREAEEES